MKKKIALFIISITMVFCLSGCYSDSPTVETFEDNYGNDYFITIEDCGFYSMNGYSSPMYMVYAKDTHVKYMIVIGHYRTAITPLYNADGTLQIYEGD